MSKGRKIVGTSIRSILIIVFTVIIFAVNSILPNYSRMLDSMINGINTKIDNSDVDTKGLDLQYNKADYDVNSIKSAEASLHQKIADEGTILLQNEDGFLPYLVSISAKPLASQEAIVNLSVGLFPEKFFVSTLLITPFSESSLIAW